jgi:hypothetical protein
MHELRLVAVSEDGSYVVLVQPGRGTRFALPNDERLRAVVRGQFSRLAQYEIEVESPLRPKEIQARIRAGETAEQIADAAGVPIERVRWFEGPVLAERAYVAQQAQSASVRRPGDTGPGPRLGEIVSERLRVLGADPEEAQWDSRKRGDGSWLVELTCDAGSRQVSGVWAFDPRRRHAMPEDEGAARLSLPEEALQAAGLAAAPPVPIRTGGTVTQFVPRSSPAAARPEQASGPAEQPARVHRSAREPGAAPAAAARHDGQPAAAALPPDDVPPNRPGQATPGWPQEPAAAQREVTQPEVPQPVVTQPEVAQRVVAAHEVAPPPVAVAADGEPGVAADAVAATAEPTPAHSRPARKAAGGRGRRASVPTWDEIMFGNSRRQD